MSWAACCSAAGIMDRPDVLLGRRAGDPVHDAAGRRRANAGGRAPGDGLTLFHYGLTGWSMYALMGIALGYFQLSLQSAADHPLGAEPDLR